MTIFWLKFRAKYFQKRPRPAQTVNRAIRSLLPRMNRKYGFQVIWSHDAGWGSQVLLVNKESAVCFVYEILESTLDVQACSAEFARSAIPSEGSINLRAQAQHLPAIFHPRFGRVPDYLQPMRPYGFLHADLRRAIRDIEKLTPEWLT